MGYRSEVILAVGPEVMPQFMVTMAKSPQARELCWADHDEMIKDYCDIKGAFLFRWGGIKWYDSYECVQAIIDFIDWCEASALKSRARKSMHPSIIASFASVRKWTTMRFKGGDLTSTLSAAQRISTSPIARFFFAKIFLFTNTKARKAQ